MSPRLRSKVWLPYCVPSASGDGSAYQVLANGDTITSSCPAGMNDRYCKHIPTVQMRLEAEGVREQARSLDLHDSLERSLNDKVGDLYR